MTQVRKACLSTLVTCRCWKNIVIDHPKNNIQYLDLSIKNPVTVGFTPQRFSCELKL